MRPLPAPPVRSRGARVQRVGLSQSRKAHRLNASIDIQIVWNENKGEVQLFIGDFRIGLPPALCAQLEKELAAARRVPERARSMAQQHNHESGGSSYSPDRMNDAGGDLERKTPVAARTQALAENE